MHWHESVAPVAHEIHVSCQPLWFTCCPCILVIQIFHVMLDLEACLVILFGIGVLGFSDLFRIWKPLGLRIWTINNMFYLELRSERFHFKLSLAFLLKDDLSFIIKYTWLSKYLGRSLYQAGTFSLARDCDTLSWWGVGSILMSWTLSDNQIDKPSFSKAFFSFFFINCLLEELLFVYSKYHKKEAIQMIHKLFVTGCEFFRPSLV